MSSYIGLLGIELAVHVLVRVGVLGFGDLRVSRLFVLSKNPPHHSEEGGVGEGELRHRADTATRSAAVKGVWGTVDLGRQKIVMMMMMMMMKVMMIIIIIMRMMMVLILNYYDNVNDDDNFDDVKWQLR